MDDKVKDKKLPGNDLAAFRSAHDRSYYIPKKIQAGLDALGSSWLYEAKFLQLCGVGNTDFSAYRDAFMEYCVETGGRNPKRIWCGTKKYAAELRAMPR